MTESLSKMELRAIQARLERLEQYIETLMYNQKVMAKTSDENFEHIRLIYKDLMEQQ